MATSESLLREWIAWFDAGRPHYQAPSRLTRKHLEQVEARRGPEPSAGDDERSARGWMGA